MSENQKKMIIFAVMTVVLAAIDFTTKQVVVSTMEVGEIIEIFGSTFGLFLIYNTGALFSFDPSKYVPFITNVHFFITFTVVVLVFLVRFVTKLDYAKQRILVWAIIFICAGAIGNGLDRIIRPNGGVVDFFMFSLGFDIGPIPFNPWPIFNVADIWVNVGIILFIIDSLPFNRKVDVR